MDDRPDVIGLACEAGGYDQRSFDAGYRLRGVNTLLADLAGMVAVGRVLVPNALVPALEALAAHVGYDATAERDDGTTVYVTFAPKEQP